MLCCNHHCSRQLWDPANYHHLHQHQHHYWHQHQHHCCHNQHIVIVFVCFTNSLNVIGAKIFKVNLWKFDGRVFSIDSELWAIFCYSQCFLCNATCECLQHLGQAMPSEFDILCDTVMWHRKCLLAVLPMWTLYVTPNLNNNQRPKERFGDCFVTNSLFGLFFYWKKLFLPWKKRQLIRWIVVAELAGENHYSVDIRDSFDSQDMLLCVPVPVWMVWSW